MKVVDKLIAYDKIKKVIKSCKTFLQLDVAERMMINHQYRYKTQETSLEILFVNQMRRIKLDNERNYNEKVRQIERNMDAAR